MGDIHGFSSLGPTVDNRLMPLVSGTGVKVYSVLGGGSFDDYQVNSGTSMASPSVAGLAALLMDAAPDHREQPALVRARLMASAVKPDAWFKSKSQFPLNNTDGPGEFQSYYGMGVVSATATILNNDTEDGWMSSGAAVEMENEEYAYHDIEVLEGTSRLDVVMTWDEPPTDAIANNVLNDLDLWVDQDADCGSGPCGEYSSVSRIDNVEWVIIENPEPGIYRLKIDAKSVYTDPPRAAIAWTAIRGASTPQLTIEASEEIYETPIRQHHSHLVDLTISTDSYIAKGVSLHIDCRTHDGKACTLGRIDTQGALREGEHSAIVQRSDGLGVAQVGNHFVLGEITQGRPTNVLLNLYADSSEPMRVYIKVMAWNGKSGHTSILFRSVGSVDEIPVASTLSNDNFDNPIVLGGSSGSQEFDLLVGSMENGEQLHESQIWREARVASSVWFQWTAEQSGPTFFVASPTSRDFPDRVPKVQIYQSSDTCCGISGARLLASANWSAQLFATEGLDYRIRVSVARESQPLSLNWSQGGRPINDNFADAVELSGESGEISGSNLGATLEVGELYGYLSSTVWYRWIAPADGQWEFQIEDAEVVHLLAFVGDDVGDLRLVTSIEEAGEEIYVNVKKDQTYHLMVASPDAYSGGWTYDSLTWREIEGRTDRNDMFVDAMDFGNGEKGKAGISHNSWPGIEPDEPESTGVQSRWWKWAAPTDGQFTFFWTNSGGDHVVAAFSGSSVSDLQSVMLENDSTTENEFVVEAQEAEEYRISIGMQRFAATAFQERWKSCNLKWGPTPSNNTIRLPTELSGSRGEAFGSLLYATTEQDGWSHLGHSAVWYEHEMEENGWVRFWIESNDLDTFRLAAFESSGALTNPELIMTSKRYYGQRDHVVEVYVLADSGMRVLLRVANDFRHHDADFTLRWEATDAPTWLTYVGRLSYGRRDGGGNVSRIRGPAEISFHTDGTAAYVTTQDGLHVYKRNTETGALTFVEVHGDISGQSHHIWDSYRSRLYVLHEQMWKIFALSTGDSLGLAHIDSFNDDNRMHRAHQLGRAQVDHWRQWGLSLSTGQQTTKALRLFYSGQSSTLRNGQGSAVEHISVWRRTVLEWTKHR